MSTTPSTPAAVASLSLESLRADVARILHEDPAEIRDDDNLIDFGLDSIRAMALITRWRNAGADIGFAECAERPELGHWWALISSRPALAAQDGKRAET